MIFKLGTSEVRSGAERQGSMFLWLPHELSDNLALFSRLQRRKKIVSLGSRRFFSAQPLTDTSVHSTIWSVSHTHLVTTGGVCRACFPRLQTEDRQTGLLFEWRKHQFIQSCTVRRGYLPWALSHLRLCCWCYTWRALQDGQSSLVQS